jgi:Poly(ADP-ribose) polymerase and DNA-Ligase Zn-finger region
MGHVIEPASSGRAKCRGCGRAIAKDELRFGERQPNAFGEGEMTLWLHLRCAAYKRPEPLLEALAEGQGASIDVANDLKAIAEFGVAHRRVPRVDGASRAPTGRARCRSCRALIEKDAWRIGLVYFEGYRFEPSGYIHAGCARDYFETIDILDRVRHFSPALEAAELDELRERLAGSDPGV